MEALLPPFGSKSEHYMKLPDIQPQWVKDISELLVKPQRYVFQEIKNFSINFNKILNMGFITVTLLFKNKKTILSNIF